MQPFTTRPELHGTFGMVASTHWLASAAGMRLLEAGGNAFDAAAAAGFVLQVVEPHLNGPGGDLPIVLYSAARDDVLVVCGQGPAPAAATTERFRELGLELVPGTGLLAACVPGAFDAWLRMLLELGTATLRDVLEPAIGYARDGHHVLPRVAESIAALESTFRADWPTSAETWLPAPAAWSLFRRPALADTYTRVLEEAEAATADRDGQIQAARDAWSRGFVAEAIGAFCEQTEVPDSSGRAHRGLLTADDLAGFEASFEAPASLSYEGWTVFKTGPWGQGPVLLQQLALLDGFDLASMGAGSAEFVHTVLECSKLAFADREAWYGDPEFADVPLDRLLSSDVRGRAPRARDRTRPREALVPGLDGARLPELPQQTATARRGRRADARRHVPPRRRRSLRERRLGDAERRLAAELARRARARLLRSARARRCSGSRTACRTRSSRASVRGRRSRRRLRARDGEVLSFGTPGGDQQDQWSLVFFLHHVLFEQNLQAAIDLPMFHSNHFPSSFYPREAKPRHVELEARFSTAVIDELRERGHDVDVTDEWSLGRLSAASRDAGGTLRAAANPRGMQGYAVGR